MVRLTAGIAALVSASSLFLFAGCASQWKIQGGPKECLAMCKNWGLQFTAMVGVGNQDTTGEGATACVCQVPARSTASAEQGGAAASTGLAAPIVAEAAAAAAAQQRNQQTTSAAKTR
jgi:hypothetical protein